jgi:FtsP/CotA-like multicopper oxidase with cupredoxin domain
MHKTLFTAFIWTATLFLPEAPALAAPIAPTATPGCEKMPTKLNDLAKYSEALLKAYGGEPFANPATVTSKQGVLDYILTAKYANNPIAGCQTHLRSYNGKLVGDTLRVHPGDILKIKLMNQLPVSADTHPQDPPPGDHAAHFSFNITNLHTHGLHVLASGNSDNVFLEVPPNSSQDYEISVPQNHPTGTFWYHAHLHGATAIQVSSGMAGALIVEGGTDANGGLDTVPEIKSAKEQIFVLQQFSFDETGQLEDFQGSFPGGERAGVYKRHITINGQLFPTISMRPGEVQRWRFVHAGVQENIKLALDNHELNEVAADGLAMGRLVPWKEQVIGPGYRTDVLVKARLRDGETRSVYYLRDGELPPALSLQAAGEVQKFASVMGLDLSSADLLERMRVSSPLMDGLTKPQAVIATVVVEGAPLDMKLPSDLSDRVPSELRKDIEDGELTGDEQALAMITAMRFCTADGDCHQTCPPQTSCAPKFLVDDHVFMPDAAPRLLKLGKPSKWSITSNSIHIFHIHVNPFQTTRLEPDGALHKIWKDTISVDSGSPVTARSRYNDFPGKFVLHCHILGHEDLGMMQSVNIE